MLLIDHDTVSQECLALTRKADFVHVMMIAQGVLKSFYRLLDAVIEILPGQVVCWAGNMYELGKFAGFCGEMIDVEYLG
ncbi:hypothetical protein D3C80_1413780 [compost metagenome]